MIYKCSKCGQEFEKEDLCKDHEQKHIKEDTPLIDKEPQVYEGYFTQEYGDYGPSFMGLDG